MSIIPKSHPRAKSLLIRERLVSGFDKGLVATEGLLAQGRGEAFDYLLGEKTTKMAKLALRAAAAQILLAKSPVISVNGNIAALCPKEVVHLAITSGSKLEVNLFYKNEQRKRNIEKILKKNGGKAILGINSNHSTKLKGLDSNRRVVDINGIFSADVVVVPLEDGDRTLALRNAGKKVITFDLNPLSRTSQTADITIVDNVIRAMPLLAVECKNLSKKDKKFLRKIVQNFDNKRNISKTILQIKKYLSRRSKIA